jgi:hypothetical protein
MLISNILLDIKGYLDSRPDDPHLGDLLTKGDHDQSSDSASKTPNLGSEEEEDKVILDY